MTTSLVGFFLDRSSADDAMAQLEAAGYSGRPQEGERFDSKWQQGRIAVVISAPNGEVTPSQAAEVHALLLRAGALDVQDGDAETVTDPMKQGTPDPDG
jgi:hypothetical protein